MVHPNCLKNATNTTGKACVRIITDLGWFDIEETDGKRELVLKEIAKGERRVREKTDAEFRVADNLIEIPNA